MVKTILSQLMISYGMYHQKPKMIKHCLCKNKQQTNKQTYEKNILMETAICDIEKSLRMKIGWFTYEDLCIAILCGMHARLGCSSNIRFLPKYCCYQILDLVVKRPYKVETLTNTHRYSLGHNVDINDSEVNSVATLGEGVSRICMTTLDMALSLRNVMAIKTLISRGGVRYNKSKVLPQLIGPGAVSVLTYKGGAWLSC